MIWLATKPSAPPKHLTEEEEHDKTIGDAEDLLVALGILEPDDRNAEVLRTANAGYGPTTENVKLVRDAKAHVEESTSQELRSRREHLTILTQRALLERDTELAYVLERAVGMALRGVVTDHLDALCRKRSMLARPDDYGYVDLNLWNKELRYFVVKVADLSGLIERTALTLLECDSDYRLKWVEGGNKIGLDEHTYELDPDRYDALGFAPIPYDENEPVFAYTLGSKDQESSDLSHLPDVEPVDDITPYRELFPDLTDLTEKAVNWTHHWVVCDDVVADDDTNSMTGAEFEIRCGEQLESMGWIVSYTAASGDQGVDIIAVMDGVSVGIQCKLHKGKIGNKAVQEVIAGRIYHQLDAAAVVASGGFTKSARRLAESDGVILLDVSDLDDLEDLV